MQNIKVAKNNKLNKTAKVITPYVDEVQSKSEKRISLSDFSFSESKKNLKSFKVSLSDAVIEERRTEL